VARLRADEKCGSKTFSASFYRVTLAIQQFELVPGKSALMEVVWVVRKLADGFDPRTKFSNDIAAAIKMETDCQQ